jgi:rhodanese-related sulfurtransferase
MFPLLLPAAYPAALLGAEGYPPREIGIFITAMAGLVLLVVYLVPRLRGLPAGLRARKFPDHKVMDPIQVEELMGGNPPIFVDLRPPEEFKGKLGRIRAARNIPFPDLRRRVEELRGSTGNRPIVLVDRTDELSHLAAAFLLEEGFDWVYVLKGGMKAWAASELPVYR